MEVQWNLDSLSSLKTTMLQLLQDAQQYEQFVSRNVRKPLLGGWKGAAGGEYQLILEVERLHLVQLTELLSDLEEAIGHVEENYQSCEEAIQAALKKIELRW